MQYHQNQTQMSLMPSKMVSHASLEQENPTLRLISRALRDALPKLEVSPETSPAQCRAVPRRAAPCRAVPRRAVAPPTHFPHLRTPRSHPTLAQHSRRLQKAFPAPAGGMRSLLYYLTTTLKATMECLSDLDRHFNGARGRGGSERPGPAAKVVGATALAGLAAGAVKAASHNPQAVAAAKQLASSARRHTDRAAKHVSQRVLRHGLKLTHNQSLVVAIGAVPVAAATALGLRKWRARSKLGFKLNECQFSLNVVMRLWTLVMNVVHR